MACVGRIQATTAQIHIHLQHQPLRLVSDLVLGLGSVSSLVRLKKSGWLDRSHVRPLSTSTGNGDGRGATGFGNKCLGCGSDHHLHGSQNAFKHSQSDECSATHMHHDQKVISLSQAIHAHSHSHSHSHSHLHLHSTPRIWTQTRSAHAAAAHASDTTNASSTTDDPSVDWKVLHERLRNQHGVIGSYGGNHAVYHAVAETKKSVPLINLRGQVDRNNPKQERGLPGMKREWLVPALKNHLDDPRTQKNWSKIVSFDPYGIETTNFRPTVSATLACMDIPEIKNQLHVDGTVVNQNKGINCIKVAIDPVWHLPSVARRLSVDEGMLRRALYDWTKIEGLLDNKSDLFLPAIGGTTLYLFGDLTAIHDPKRAVATRPHDECNGSDVFGTDICTCRPYLVHAIAQAVGTAQRNGLGMIAYFRKEGRALGEVTKFRVYNLRKYQEGGDRAETYFEMTQAIAGVVDARAQELMPDVFHWLGIDRITTLLSMSGDKYNAITQSGRIKVINRESLPEDMVPENAQVEISAKISSGYQGFQPKKSDENKDKRYVYTLEAVRERCKFMLDKALENKLNHFEVNMAKMENTVGVVLNCMKRHYPDFVIPPHSRMRHFEAGGFDRIEELSTRWKRYAVDSLESTRRKVDLIMVSVLLDAGAGPTWKYIDHNWGEKTFTRSEGLALASLDMFRNSMFSSSDDMRVDSKGLRSLTLDDLERGFQVSNTNQLIGAKGRHEMLQRLADALDKSPEHFGSPHGIFRPGNLVDHILKHAYSNAQRVSVRVLWQAVMDGLSTVFPDNSGLGIGDAYHHDVFAKWGKTKNQYQELVPFHKLAQWMTYSLIEPMSQLGINFVDEWLLTGLAEYRNGGLFIDTHLLVPKKPEVLFKESFKVSDEPIVEWRALTVGLLDKVAIEIWDRLGKTEREMPMARILEGGTWRSGRELAFEKRENGAPPISIRSTGDVF